MKAIVLLVAAACCLVGFATRETHQSVPCYVRQAFVDPSLEIMLAETTTEGKIEWEGITIDFENDRDVGRRMQRAIKQGVGSQVVLDVPLDKAIGNFFGLLKNWVLFCEKWQIPYSVTLYEQVGETFRSCRIAFSGRLEGNEILTIRDWAAIETGGARTATLEQLQTQLRDDFVLNRSHHFEIRLTRQALEGDGAKNLAALVNQLNANPPPLCWYRIALLAK